MRGDNRKVTIFIELPAEEVLELVSHHGASRKPQRKAHSDAAGEGEEFHFLAEFPVVALLCLFENHEVLVQEGFLGEGYAVDTGELLTLLVASPVGSGYAGELDGLDDFGVHQMRAAAEVGEFTVAVVCDGTVLELADELALVLVSLFLEVLHRLALGDVYPLEMLLLACEFEHLLLNLRKVGVGDGLSPEVHVVVESVLYGRSNTELHARIESLEGLGHQV